MSDLVSVVLPVGPGARGALEALEDLKRQSWRELEIIAVLNGCPKEIREAYQMESSSRLRLIDHGDTPNLLKALSSAIDASSGKWLARMDTDDRCHPERVEKTLQPLLRGECDVASCGIELIDPIGQGMQRYVDWVNGLTDQAQLSRERFIESPVVQPTVIMSKELFLEAGGYLDDGFAEDYSLWLRLLALRKRFGKVTERLYSWRDHEERLTRNDDRFSQKKMLALKAQALSQLPDVQERGVTFCGAGPIAKVLARELLAREITVLGFFEIDPKRIGSICQGKPIADYRELGSRWRSGVQLSAVGTPGGRDVIREAARKSGFKEGCNFWCCC